MYKDISPENIKLDITLGYLYFIDHNHPLASSVGKVMLHRHIASIHLNKWVASNEHVHHIDGNKLNNSVNNLEILSAEEHGKLHKPAIYSSKILSCPVCHKLFEVIDNPQVIRVTCSTKCAGQRSRKFDVSKEDLEILLWNLPMTTLAEHFKVSDTAVRKRAKVLGCKMPPARFHNKTKEFCSLTRKENNIPDLSPQQSSKLLT